MECKDDVYINAFASLRIKDVQSDAWMMVASIVHLQKSYWEMPRLRRSRTFYKARFSLGSRRVLFDSTPGGALNRRTRNTSQAPAQEPPGPKTPDIDRRPLFKYKPTLTERRYSR